MAHPVAQKIIFRVTCVFAVQKSALTGKSLNATALCEKKRTQLGTISIRHGAKTLKSCATCHLQDKGLRPVIEMMTKNEKGRRLRRFHRLFLPGFREGPVRSLNLKFFSDRGQFFVKETVACKTGRLLKTCPPFGSQGPHIRPAFSQRYRIAGTKLPDKLTFLGIRISAQAVIKVQGKKRQIFHVAEPD